MNKIIRKITILCMTLVLMMSVINMDIRADEPVITYGVEYGDNTATVTFYITVVEAFDIAVAYDPAKLTVSDCGYTMDFKKLQVGGENTTISVLNDNAKDDAGNTYVVFTGAGADMTTNAGIEFAGKPLCYVTFEGDLSGSELTIVTDSATADNVYNATPVGKITLDVATKTEVTPKPIENVVYEKVEEEEKDSSDEQSDSSENKDETEVNANTETDTASSTDEATDTPTETTDSITETESVDDTADEKAVSDKDADDAEDSSINPVILGILIAVAVVLIAAVVVVLIRKKKK